MAARKKKGKPGLSDDYLGEVLDQPPPQRKVNLRGPKPKSQRG